MFQHFDAYERYIIIQGDSNFLSGFLCIGYGNPDDNSESLYLSREKEE